MKLIGKKLLFRYQSGLEVIGEYSSATEVRWEALTGPAKGTSGNETCDMAEIGPNLFVVGWVEKSGTTVTQFVDLERLSATCYVTFDTPDGRQGMLDSGVVLEQ